MALSAATTSCRSWLIQLQTPQRRIQSIIEMSITVSNCNEICNCPLNISKSKMLYTFAKSQRFHSTKKILYFLSESRCDKFYNLPSTVDSHTSTFGYGTKFDFTKCVPNTPPPNTYEIKTLFDEAKNHKVGFGFGEGREEMQCTGPLSIVRTNRNPGPGSYELPSTLSKSSYSFRERTHLESDEARKVPGPGNYPVTFTMNKTGSYFLSKFKNSCATTFNPKHSERFRYLKNRVPGPGAYDLSQTCLSSEGKYFPSKFRSSLVRSFPHSMRKTISLNSLTPGPGNYKLPSEFGHYISRDAYKEDKQNAKPDRSESPKERTKKQE